MRKINPHTPFFKQRHVLPSQKELVGCNKDLAGIKENASWTGRGFTTAYYYYLYGFGIQNVREIEKLENRAICKFDLIEKDKTKAYQYFNEHDYNPDRIEGKVLPAKRYSSNMKKKVGNWNE